MHGRDHELGARLLAYGRTRVDVARPISVFGVPGPPPPRLPFLLSVSPPSDRTAMYLSSVHRGGGVVVADELEKGGNLARGPELSAVR